MLIRTHVSENCSVESLFFFLGFVIVLSLQESRITTGFDRREQFPVFSEKTGSGYFKLESAMPVWKPTFALKMDSYFFPFYSGLRILTEGQLRHNKCMYWSVQLEIVSCNCCVVQSPSHVRLFATPRTAACEASLSFTVSQNLPKFMSIASVIQPSHPLTPSSPSSLYLSQHQALFQWVVSHV